MAMTLDQLKRSRTTRKTNISKLILNMQIAVDNKQQLETERYLAQLELKEAAFHDVARNLEIATTDEALLDLAIQENEAYFEEIVDAKISAHRMLASLKSVTSPPVGAVSQTSTSAVSRVVTKLPKLFIKKFDGNLSDWERFWDQFSAGVDANTSLSKVDKFNYLKGFLSENASLTISGLSLTDANYDIATDLLRKKYGQTDFLIAEHVRQLLEIKKIVRIDNGQELRLLFENFHTHLRALENLGKGVSSMGTLLCPTLLKALPYTMIREWHRQTAGQANDNLKLLLEFIQQEIEGVELAYRNNVTSNVVKTDRKSFKSDSSVTTASTLVATSTQSNANNGPKAKLPCIFCTSSQHFSLRCPEYPTRDDRAPVLLKQGRCLRCLSRNHPTQSCDSNYKCFKCRQPHHSLLCNKNFRKEDSSQRMESKNREETSPKIVAHTSSQVLEVSKTLVASLSSKQNGKFLSILQTLKVWIKHQSGQTQAVVLLDCGSERSFVTQRLSQNLKLPILQTETLTVHAFGGQSVTQSSNRVSATLIGHNGNSLDVTLLEVPEISTGVRLWENSQIESYLHTHKIRYNWQQAMGDGSKVKVDILIGADLYWKFLTGHMKRLSPGLMASQTIFGWTILGSIDTFDTSKQSIAMFTQCETFPEESLDSRIAQLWELDRSGILAQEEQCPRTLQEIEVLDQFQKTTVFKENRYQVRIPWNTDKSSLCNNFALAKQRLKGLIMQLQKNPLLLERYRTGIYEYLNNQHTEIVEESEPSGPLFYLPHHPIIKEDRKTTKLRIVFDGSAHDSTGKSLNQCQHTGPNLNPTIFALLIRFRSHKIAISSDVEKAFLQVSLDPKDRDATRFLWTDSEWTKQEDPPIIVFRMARVLFGMKSSPFLLAATIRHHVAQYSQNYPIVGPLLDQNTYVDDFISGSKSFEAALSISCQAKDLMDKASLPLKKWATNDTKLREKWIAMNWISPDEPVELLKILGLMWDPVADNLFFKTAALKSALETCLVTKRSILEILARIFDPLGFLSPKLVSLKILLQELWRSKVTWDEPLQDPFKSTWNNWKSDLVLLEEFRLNRWYGTLDVTGKDVQLHVFCDSSMRAYGAVAYLRIVCNNEVKTSFVCSKTRVAPLKLISIPRLELLACLVGARLANTLKLSWNSNMDTYLWTDSQVALQWIASVPSKWKVFVARRIQEVQSLTESHQWNYCCTKDNPADILSRGMALKLLFQSDLWWQGPKWISQQTDWNFKQPLNCSISSELIQNEESHSLVVIANQAEEVFDPQRFSTWNKIIRVTAWIIRFLRNCHKQADKNKNHLSIQELKNAELYWFHQMQIRLFPQELHFLENKAEIPSNSSIFAFQPFLDRAGTMRMTGRLHFANINVNQAHPVLLKGGGNLVDLFILDRHEKTLHGGIQSTLIKIREEVWLLKGRQAVRSALKKCLICRKWTAKPYVMVEAPLPAARINQSQPFEVTGLDFAGPVWVKVANDKTKAYICLFTCAVTRSVHLELTLSQNLKHFLWAFRRFTARRGGVRVVYSDNAATFSQADRLLKEAFQDCRHAEIQEWAVRNSIEWRFIPPRAAWWGGFYERIVSTIKRHLRRTLGAALMSPDELATLLTEIEATINARPLTHLSDDPEDHGPLTPSHFLNGRQTGPLLDILPLLNTPPVKPILLKKWQCRKRLMDNFWRQWTKEYLLQLHSAHKLAVPIHQSKIKVGDVVLVKESRLPRGQWKMAVIEEFYEGRDGNIRSLLLRTPSGTPLRRAVQDVCPLELT